MARSGEWCAKTLQNSMEYITEQGNARENGVEDNIITKTLAGGPMVGMRTDDWTSFYADIPSGAVQYGGRAGLCDYIKALADKGITEGNDLVEAMIKYGADNGTTVNDYATSTIADTTIDVNSSARPWTY